MKKCWMKNCAKEVAFTCQCKGNVFSCLDHLGVHLLTDGNHQHKPVVASVNNQKVQQIKTKIIAANELYRKLEKSAIKASLEIINKIVESLHKFTKKLKDLANENSDLLRAALTSSTVDIQILNKIEAIDSTTFPEFNCISLIREIESFFKVDLDSKNLDDEFAVYHPAWTSGNTIDLINLDTLTEKTILLKSGPDSYSACASCYLGKSNYFLYGGYPVVGSARIINIDSCDVTPLPASYPNCFVGACLFQQSVYVFGGASQGTIPLATSQRFCLNEKEWQSICSLPIASFCTSASVIEGKIYVSGFQMPQVLIYNQTADSFSDFTYIGASLAKYLFGKWIVTAKGELFEFYHQEFVKRQNHAFTIGNLSNFATFRRNNFIYYVTDPLSLYRINPTTKSVEEIVF